MSEKKFKVDEKRFDQLVNVAYKKISCAVFPLDRDADKNESMFHAMAGTQALLHAVRSAMQAMRGAGLVPQDLGEALIQQAEDLNENMHKSVSAQGELLRAAQAERENAPSSKELH